MPRYTDIDLLIDKVEGTDWYHISKQGELVRGANSKDDIPLYKHSDIKEVLNNAPEADVVPKSELDNLEYTLMGVMHSVDKWLDGDELNQHEVNRAITMREKTLQIVERLQDEAKNLRNANADLALALLYECTPTKEHLSELEKAVRDKVAREIFEEIDSMIFGTIIPDDCAIISIARLAELKKKYTEDQT